MVKDRVTVLFNYRSPFCALIVDRLFALEDKFDIVLDWRIAGDVPRPSSLPITPDNPRLAYNRQDCARRAAWLGLPWNPPSDWRLTDVQAASRVGLWLQKQEHPAFEPFTLACSRAYWCHQQNVSDAEVVNEIARDTGVSSDDLAAIGKASDDLDRELAETMAQADENGVLGVPYFTFRDQAFWGSDRFDDLMLSLSDAGLRRAGTPPLASQLPDPDRPVVPIEGQRDGLRVGRIFCVGRNYAAHAAEMGVDANREAPFFFFKYPEGLVLDGTPVTYPPMTSNYHYEMELVVAMKDEAKDIEPSEADARILGYAAGLDMTRRDLQLAARDKGRPWDTGKSFDESAVIGALRLAEDVSHPLSGRIALSVNGDVKQDADLEELIWSVPEIISNLSKHYTLRPGDLIFTGTPAGVGAVVAGDEIEGSIEGIGTVHTKVRAADE